MRAFNQRITFTVPAGVGAYAPEVITLTRGPQGSEPGGLAELSQVIEALPAGAAIELDLLKPGGDPAVAGDWLLTMKSWTTAGLQDLVSAAFWPGARLRAKSGGTAGNAIVSASWD